MDLRDEVAGTEGTIWVNHFLRTGFEMFTAGGAGGYVAEKAEAEPGWMFPVGDEVVELGYVDMFSDMFDALDDGAPPQETFYDGYVVNAVMDACFRSAKVTRLGAGRAGRLARRRRAAHWCRTQPEMYDGKVVIKSELLPDGRRKMILKDPASGDFTDLVVAVGAGQAEAVALTNPPPQGSLEGVSRGFAHAGGGEAGRREPRRRAWGPGRGRARRLPLACGLSEAPFQRWPPTMPACRAAYPRAGTGQRRRPGAACAG